MVMELKLTKELVARIILISFCSGSPRAQMKSIGKATGKTANFVAQPPPELGERELGRVGLVQILDHDGSDFVGVRFGERRADPFVPLALPYKPHYWWFEVFEMTRKFLMTGMPILLVELFDL